MLSVVFKLPLIYVSVGIEYAGVLEATWVKDRIFVVDIRLGLIKSVAFSVIFVD